MSSLCLLLCGIAGAQQLPSFFDMTKCGAVPDGKTLDSPAINPAIDSASAAGGGTVYLPAGTWLSGSIRLKSNVTLYLEQGSTVLATSDPPA